MSRHNGTTAGRLPEAIVIGKGPTALGAIRSLAFARVPVGLVSSDATDPVMRSRYAKHKHVFPGDVLTAGADFCDFLEGRLFHGSVLIPTSDVAVQWMASQRTRLEKSFRFCIPSDQVLASLLDKSRQVEAVQRFGIPVPKTVHMMRPAEEIIAFCREKLAAYKVPKLVEFRTSLPKSVIGKVLRKVLRDEEEVKKQER